MLSINIYIRFAIIGFCILLSIIFGLFTEFSYALPAIIILMLVAIVLLVGYFLLGTIQSSAMLMQSGDIEGAKKRLALTKKPEWLFGPNKMMYYMVNGTMAMQERDLEKGEEWFLKADAIKTKMPSENETAMVKIQLAALNANRRKWNQASSYLKEAKKLNVTNAEIKHQMQEIEQIVKTKGMSHAKRIKPKGRKGFRYHK